MKKLFLTLSAFFIALASFAQCQADFGYSNVTNVYTFSDSSTAGSGTIQAWLWQFGDNSAPSTQQNPVHTYDACGYYVVSLSIVTTSFCNSTYTDTIFVAQGIQPSFTFNVDTTNGDVTFNASPNSTMLSYSWDFGDSNTGTGMNTIHTYASAGTYIVCLTTSDTGGFCTYMICDTVIVTIAPPNCNVTWTNMSIIAGQQTFTAQPFDPNWTYTWDFGDASAPGNGFITNHTYASAGTYTVCLTVVDSTNACTSQFCDTVQVVFPSNCPVTFTNIYLAGNMAFTPTPLNPLNTYVWDFGDASAPFTGMIANHTYAAPGTYTVCVTMTTFQGCTDTFCDTVIVPNTIGINESEENSMTLQLMPNPADENVTVTFTMKQSDQVTIEITDITGRAIITRSVFAAGGENRESISLASLASGAYIVRVVNESGCVQSRLIKE